MDGFRLDAVKSIDAGFFAPWLRTMQRYGNHPGIAVGEYWSGDAGELTSYLHDCNHCMMLFDVALHFRFEQASKNPEGFDLRGLAADTLYEREPTYACTFVDNHDTQPGQALESLGCNHGSNRWRTHAFCYATPCCLACSSAITTAYPTISSRQ